MIKLSSCALLRIKNDSVFRWGFHGGMCVSDMLCSCLVVCVSVPIQDALIGLGAAWRPSWAPHHRPTVCTLHRVVHLGIARVQRSVSIYAVCAPCGESTEVLTHSLDGLVDASNIRAMSMHDCLSPCSPCLHIHQAFPLQLHLSDCLMLFAVLQSEAKGQGDDASSTGGSV